MDPQRSPVPTAQVSDPDATAAVTETLNDVHGQSYEFAVERWETGTVLEPAENQVAHHVVVDAEEATAKVAQGDTVRGPPPDGPYRNRAGRFATATDAHRVDLWAGDVVTLLPDDDPVAVTGAVTSFAVRTEPTSYPAPRLCLLRHLPDEVGGCAAYADAFRREALPPVPADDPADARGVNRANVHVLDMRHDREPTPVQHCHAPVTSGTGARVPHTETAIVLDRSQYDLPPVDASEPHVRIFRDPRAAASDWVDVPVEPGSIVVTPATETGVYGHCFRNAFAALVAVPSFTAPLTELGEDRHRDGDAHRKYHE